MTTTTTTTAVERWVSPGAYFGSLVFPPPADPEAHHWTVGYQAPATTDIVEIDRADLPARYRWRAIDVLIATAMLRHHLGRAPDGALVDALVDAPGLSMRRVEIPDLDRLVARGTQAALFPT